VRSADDDRHDRHARFARQSRETCSITERHAIALFERSADLALATREDQERGAFRQRSFGGKRLCAHGPGLLEQTAQRRPTPERSVSQYCQSPIAKLAMPLSQKEQPFCDCSRAVIGDENARPRGHVLDSLAAKTVIDAQRRYQACEQMN
jgi:hypothetical protein